VNLVPVDQLTARRFVNEHHRHNEAPDRWRFGVGLANGEGELVGVAMVGNPVARKLAQADPFLCEITRVATTGDKNANSMLYGAACRMAKAGGYRSVITYTLPEESGASLLAAGFVLEEELPPVRGWSMPSRPRYEETLLGPRKRPAGPKYRWRRQLVREAVAA
jgi:hypothetical protein